MKTFCLFPLLVFLCIGFISCEFDPDIHYVEIEKPAENYVFQLNLTDIPFGETIFIYGVTSLYYELTDLPDGAFPLIRWSMDGGELYQTNGLIVIDPSQFEEKEYTLDLEISMRTHSGSLADVVGLERYIGSYSFPLQFVDVPQRLNLRQEVTEDRKLKILWDRPKLPQVEVERYELTYFDVVNGGVRTVEINDPDQTWWIDPDYVYGYHSFRILTVFKDYKIPSWENGYEVDYPVLSPDSFICEPIGLDKISISLAPYPYRARWLLMPYYNMDDQTVLTEEQFPLIADRPVFPEPFYYRAELLPMTSDKPLGVYVIEHHYANFYLNWFPKYSSSIYDSTLYFTANQHQVRVDAGTFEIISDTDDDYEQIFCDPRSPRRVTVKDNQLFLHRNDKLTDPVKTQVDISTILTVTYTEDNRLFVFGKNNNGYTSALAAVNAETGAFLYACHLPDYDSSVSARFSCDGRYVLIYNEYASPLTVMDIYELTGPDAVLIKSFPAGESAIATFRSRFHPTDPSLFIYSTNNYISLMQIPSFDEIPVADLFASGTLMDTDPFTGNLLCRVSELGEFHITDPELKKSLYQFPAISNILNCQLRNNHLVRYNPYKVSYQNFADYFTR